MPIPSFSASGVLPHCVNNNPTDPNSRSPYRATIFELVEAFCTSRERANLLLGLNQYRKHLFEGGFVNGFQWIDGSFVENVEVRRNRPPRDIDIITFFHRPNQYMGQEKDWRHIFSTNIHPIYFDSEKMKPIFLCDTYCAELDSHPRALISSATYWSGLFSDTRESGMKKGIVEISLAYEVAEFDDVANLVRSRFDV